METIKSQDNKTIKNIAKLKLKKYRDECGEYIAEGFKNVLDTCAARPDLVVCVVMSESAYRKYGERFSEHKNIVVADDVFVKLADTESSQGIICVSKKPSFESASISEQCIFLDRVRDPGNVGTILRTAVACGYDVVLNNCADIYSPKVVRSAMSAVVKCKTYEHISVKELKKLGYEIIVADMSGESVFVSAHGTKYCVVIGNEAEGVSEEISKQADKLLSIPQENMESLNAGVAAGVMMFALKYATKVL